ncbi:serine proteases 1/2-like [Sergentomyia squamirostris]
MECPTKVCLASVMIILIHTVMTYDIQTIMEIRQIANDETWQSRIINGYPATEGQFPYVCQLLIDKTTIVEMGIIREISLCTCSIISAKWVLTAGHCIMKTNASLEETVEYSIQCGSIYADNQDPDFTRNVSESNAFRHPNYNENTLENDVGLIYISPAFDLELNSSLLTSIPINCPPNITDFESDYLTVAGFGNIYTNDTLPTQLYWTDELEYMNKLDCENDWQFQALPNSSFCAWDYTTPASSICNGDSGCPIITPDIIQVGIGSYGANPCNALPQGFTDLANEDVCHWILKRTKKGH